MTPVRFVGRMICALLAVAIAGCNMPAAVKTDPPKAADAWTPLFNGKNLDGFYVFLDKSGKNHDTKNIFKVENGMIHVMDLPPSTETQETGYLCTEKSYGRLLTCKI